MISLNDCQGVFPKSNEGPVPGVYFIGSAQSVGVYIGSSKSLYVRHSLHKSHLKAGKHYNKALQAAYLRGEKIEFRVFKRTVTKDEALDLEQKLLSANWGKPWCLNISADARASQKGYRRPDEHRLKMSLARKGRALSILTKQRMRETWYAGRDRSSLIEKLKASVRARMVPVEIRGIRYESLAISAQQLGLPRPTVRSRIFSKSPKFKDWKLL